ncbi:MAG TPA: type II toxin-antitoxin system PemK/MazF family toxin [Vicinamibacteria bacterium]|nr:type II toxin-antitoxin system PemK/MazF family toxin [Vicinamibacteria bacterium]
MKQPRRGEVWLVDLGLAAKIRPALVLSVPPGDNDRALVTVVPHTTSLRGTKLEAVSGVSFLKAGAFDAQGIVTIPLAKLMRLIGTLKPEQLANVETCVRGWLGLSEP